MGLVRSSTVPTCPHCAGTALDKLLSLTAPQGSTALDASSGCLASGPYPPAMGHRCAARLRDAQPQALSFTPEEQARNEVTYNYAPQPFECDELPGISVFCKNDAGEVLHTYSAYRRGVEAMMGTYHLLDLTPQGRDELETGPMGWVRHHDRYVFSFQPVRKIHHTAAMHSARKPVIAATLTATLTSAMP